MYCLFTSPAVSVTSCMWWFRVANQQSKNIHPSNFKNRHPPPPVPKKYTYTYTFRYFKRCQKNSLSVPLRLADSAHRFFTDLPCFVPDHPTISFVFIFLKLRARYLRIPLLLCVCVHRCALLCRNSSRILVGFVPTHTFCTPQGNWIPPTMVAIVPWFYLRLRPFPACVQPHFFEIMILRYLVCLHVRPPTEGTAVSCHPAPQKTTI